MAQEQKHEGTDNVGGLTKPSIYWHSPAFISDNGVAIGKVIKSRKEDIGDWSIFKVLKLFYVLFRNVQGNVSVTLLLEGRTGISTAVKTFTISGAGQTSSGGWGNDQWGSIQWGFTKAKIVITPDEIARYSNIFKNCRVAQVQVSASDTNSNFEFLAVRMTAQPLGDQSLPAADKV